MFKLHFILNYRFMFKRAKNHFLSERETRDSLLNVVWMNVIN